MGEGQGRRASRVSMQQWVRMAVEVGRRVAGFKEEQARRVMEVSWRKETRSNKIRQGGRVLKSLYVRSSAR
jgi:hypothetical protein